MRLILLPFSVAVLLLAPAQLVPAFAQDHKTDPALHCAALMTLSGDLLAAGGKVSHRDMSTVAKIAGIMLSYSTLPETQRKSALQAYVTDFCATHSDKQILRDVQKNSDTCISDFM